MADKVPVTAAVLLFGGFAFAVLWPPFGPPVMFLGTLILLRHVIRAFIAFAHDQYVIPAPEHRENPHDAQ